MLICIAEDIAYGDFAGAVAFPAGGGAEKYFIIPAVQGRQTA